MHNSFNTGSVPLALQQRAQWVVWRLEERDGKPTKPPVDQDGRVHVDASDPATWMSFDEAVRCCEAHGLDGIGFAVTADDPFSGIDLDNCRDPVTGEIETRARDIIAELNSYTEITPSGRGVRVWVKASLPPGRRKRGRIEMYDRARYFTVTGRHLDGTPTTIEARAAEVAALHARIFATSANGQRPPWGTSAADPDDATVERALRARNGDKFRRLWSGDCTGYQSPSEADLALCDMLAFHTGGGADRIDRLFRQSALYRPKWDEPHAADGATYGEMTIQMAIGGSRAYTPPPEQGATFRQGAASSTSSDPRRKAPDEPWPVLAREAFHGVMGALVDTIAPHSEADPVAILAQALVIFGNIVGRGPHFKVEDDRHGTNENITTVGSTGHGRKGVGYGRARRPFLTIDPGWIDNCVQGGLSSGEGLIAAVRDPAERLEPVKEKGRVVDYTTVIADPGVTDKRLLVVETEFAKVLRVMERDGNTLSPIMRQAWDSGDLRVMTRKDPLRATGAHISIIGHITRDELLRYLTSTEAANGLANRFLWLWTHRAQVLPDGGNLTGADIAPFVERLRAAVEFGRSVGLMARDDAAREIWHAVYPKLSAGAPGLLGAVTSRAEAHVLRFSLIYALLDRSATVRPEHLMAALALWEYAEASARCLFGSSLGDPTADEILRALRHAPDGLTITQIHEHFGRHQRKAEIDRALGVLLDQDLGYPQQVETAGRTATRWRAARVT